MTTTGSDQAARFDAALERFQAATPLTRATHLPTLRTGAQELLQQEGGLQELYDRAGRFDDAGLFQDTPWQDPGRLQPRLVAGSLVAETPTAIMEVLSELRMLAIAMGRTTHTDVSQEDALLYLERTIAVNLDFLFPRNTEAAREWTAKNKDRFDQGARLFHFLLDALPHMQFLQLVVQEIEEICVQRRIWTRPVRNMIRLASDLPGAAKSDDQRLMVYVEAVLGPSPMSRRFRSSDDYRKALSEVDASMVENEAETCAASLRRTGLACPQHAVLLRHVRHEPALLARALGLDAKGTLELRRSHNLVRDLVAGAVYPGNEQTIYGLARLIERGLLSWTDVATGLRGLMDTPLLPDVQNALLTTRGTGNVSAHALLLGGAIRVLGQPLGIGQGRNPTCQAARGMSLWSQHNPGYLLQLIASAARDGDIVLRFNNEDLHSKDLHGGLAWDFDPELDPVSIVLVPHLDRVYDEMMRRVQLLPGDGHQYVNPAMYGRIVPLGFATCFDTAAWQVRGHDAFVRRFYATHHPDHNGGRPLQYPNPVGIFVTTVHARLLGLHAVSIQRVAEGPDGDVRVYFFNPNDEGRQDWGQGIRPSIWKHGEEEGESSLPFAEFASRMYAFHYSLFDEGEGSQVPDETLAHITRLARESWGKNYAWVQDGQILPPGGPPAAGA